MNAPAKHLIASTPINVGAGVVPVAACICTTFTPAGAVWDLLIWDPDAACGLDLRALWDHQYPHWSYFLRMQQDGSPVPPPL